MNRYVAASCGLVFVLFSFGFLSAQEEPTRSEEPAENRALAERVEKLKDEVAGLKKIIVVMTERLKSQAKKLRVDRQHIVLLMKERTEGHERVRRAVERHQAEGRSRPAPEHASQEQSTKTSIFDLQHARAADLAETLEDLFPTKDRDDDAVRIAQDERNNLILVTAPQEQLDVIEEVIKVVDRPTEEARIKIFSLEHASASESARIVENLFRPRRPGQGLRIAVDDRSNSIIVIAPPEQQKTIEALLLSLDQPQNKHPTEKVQSEETSP